MRLRQLGQALFCFLFVIGLAARAEAIRLRLSVPVHGVSHVAFYAAKEKGYFQEEGLDVEVILMSGAIGIRALIAGDVDASTVGGSALPPIFRGAPLRMVFISFDKPTHWLYAKPDIRAVKDLKDKKVAVDGLGGTLESLLRSVLEKNGLEAGRDVPILAIGPAAGPLCRADQRSDRRHSLYVPAQLQGRRGRLTRTRELREARHRIAYREHRRS
jgi:ABC-type nitrate/sulfonate/bicarbonate transport system substrate-binding protein